MWVRLVSVLPGHRVSVLQEQRVSYLKIVTYKRSLSSFNFNLIRTQIIQLFQTIRAFFGGWPAWSTRTSRASWYSRSSRYTISSVIYNDLKEELGLQIVLTDYHWNVDLTLM